ncbi:MAG TPA: hypothetical protein VF217_00185, partial [Rhodanobacteraceae bacterium]
MASRGFWRELKRRHVYRVAAAYALVGWLLIQVATQVFPVFHLPDWIDQTVVLLILLGFPIALVLAWAFDATPQGIVRTDASSLEGGADAQPRGRSQRAGIAVGLTGVLIAVAAGAGWWYMQHGRDVVAQESRAIADKLQVQLSGGNEATLVAQKSVDPRAHDFYLRGLTLLAARSVGEA